MQVLDAVLADAPQLHALHLRTWVATYRMLLPPEYFSARLAGHLERDWAELLSDQTAIGGGILTACCAGAPRGLCQYGPTEDDDDDAERVGHVHRLYVDPEWQRQGIGGSLLRAATARLWRCGFSTATLWALAHDQRARSFYERLGWRADGGRRCDGVLDVRYRIAGPRARLPGERLPRPARASRVGATRR